MRLNVKYPTLAIWLKKKQIIMLRSMRLKAKIPNFSYLVKKQIMM